MKREEAKALLKSAVKDENADFHEGQWEAIDSLVNHNRKLLVVQRTGWGKSAVYFISTRILRDRGAGHTLIVSPLLALMRNQITAAERLGIHAVTINSSNTDEWEQIEERVLKHDFDALLISPERLSNEDFVEQVLLPIADTLSLFVVDEAHCISDWGHDFRPDYRRLVNVLKQMPPNMPVLGTTATANNRVIEDIQSQLGDVDISRGSLVRDSLRLQTLRLPDQSRRLAWLAEHIPNLPGTGIVYALTRRDTEQVTAWLIQNGIDAKAYYSGIEDRDFENTDAYRLHLEEQLLNNKLKVLVATSALGMGYDKPDLGFVIHYQAPGSVVGYYQQVGRAGRAINEAYGILLSGHEDDEINEYFRHTAFPKEAHVNEILSLLEKRDGIPLKLIQQEINLKNGHIKNVLKYLSVENPAPVIKQDSKWYQTPITYQMNRGIIAHLTQQREKEYQEVQDYIDTKECYMNYLRTALDDPGSEECGQCAICIGKPIVPVDFEHDKGLQAAHFLKHAEIPIEPRKQTIAGGLPNSGLPYRIPVELRAEEGRALSHWGDAGWGHIVADDKHHDHFRDELVAAVVVMVNEKWKPEPAPQWVTCVPSRRHPKLVPDFAQRVAEKLELPFKPIIEKVQDNQAQKLQQNSHHQCKNIDSAFKVTGEVMNTPVLLMDDIVDSRWTMTILVALLRQVGSGPVFPVALASLSTGD